MSQPIYEKGEPCKSCGPQFDSCKAGALCSNGGFSDFGRPAPQPSHPFDFLYPTTRVEPEKVDNKFPPRINALQHQGAGPGGPATFCSQLCLQLGECDQSTLIMGTNCGDVERFCCSRVKSMQRIIRIIHRIIHYSSNSVPSSWFPRQSKESREVFVISISPRFTGFVVEPNRTG